MAKRDEQVKRVRGDELVRVRAGHEREALRTQQGLATHAGISTRTVARAEDGFASFETIEQLALALGVPVWSLWIPLDDRFAPPMDTTTKVAAPARDDKIDEMLKILRHMDRTR